MDDIEDEEVELTKEETKMIRRMLKGRAPHADFDPHAVCIFLCKKDLYVFCL